MLGSGEEVPSEAVGQRNRKKKCETSGGELGRAWHEGHG